MTSNTPMQQITIVLLMMSIGFYLQELPFSNVLQMVLPEWPFILMLYFSVSTRYFLGVTGAFCIGLIEDVFLMSPMLGLHAGIYVLSAFIIIVGRLKFRHLSLASQSLSIAALVALKILILFIYNAIIYRNQNHFWELLSIPLSALAWPALYLFFQFFALQHQDS